MILGLSAVLSSSSFFFEFFMAGALLSPESPWYLVRQNRLEEAHSTLQRLYGESFDVGPKLATI